MTDLKAGLTAEGSESTEEKKSHEHRHGLNSRCRLGALGVLGG
jgi:hypothetical protein